MSKKLLFTIFLCLVCTVAAFAQDSEEAHNDASFSVGAGVPVGSDTSYLNTAPMIALNYGYRFNRYLQAEGGFQMAFISLSSFLGSAALPRLTSCLLSRTWT